MLTVTSVEIIEYRAELSGDPDALRTLEMLEDCEGDLEDAAISLALQVGQEPSSSEQWLESLVKRWRHIICQPEVKQSVLAAESVSDVMKAIAESVKIPTVLLVLVAIYLHKSDVAGFCQAFEQLES